MSDLDDILDSALEELEETEKTQSNNNNLNNNNNNNNSNSPFPQQPGNTEPLFPSSSSGDSGEGGLSEEEQFIQQFTSAIKESFNMGTNTDNNNNNNDNGNPFSSEDNSTSQENQDNADFQQNIQKTLNLLQESADGLENVTADSKEEPSENIMQGLMKSFENLENDSQFQSIIENMMKQLLAKDVLYEPLVTIRDKYPEWLEKNRSELSSEDYDRYSKQHKIVQQICSVYETDPDNFQNIVDLMQEMQDCGQPPEEIVSELSSDLEGSDGQLPDVLQNLTGGGSGGGEEGGTPMGERDCIVM